MAAAPISPPSRTRVHPTATTATREGDPREPTTGGALLAVCGVGPQAGASTLSQLIALAAARRRDSAVLLCHTRTPEPPEPTATTSVRRSLLELFLRPAGDGSPSVRVVRAPAGDEPAAAARFACKLLRARAIYALTIVDCGPLRRPIERIVLAHATHTAWVLPATADGLAEARRAIRGTRAPAAGRRLLIARGEPTGDAAALPALRQLAAECDATLILVPSQLRRALVRPSSALDGAQIALQAVLGALER